MLQRVLREEPARPPRGQYVYAHAVLPHGPYVLAPDCRFVGKRELRRQHDEQGLKEGYLGQAECALRLVARFLDQLRALGRYDAATIVIHADTGNRIGFFDESVRDDGAKTLGWNSYRLRSQVYALLAIKPPGASGPLEVRNTPTQLVDLFPTLLDLLDLAAPDYPVYGRSVYAAGGAPREARFGFDPARRHGHEIVEVRVDDPVHLARSPLTVIGPAIDPATWRGASRTDG
jgi:arylsulfatase A-like enzyme